MWPGLTADFLTAIRLSNIARFRLEAWRAGVNISNATYPNGLRFSGASVSEDSSGGVRRKLACTFPELRARGKPSVLADLLAPTGTELRAWRGLQYPSGKVELVPQGVFVIDSQTMDYGDGSIDISAAPDRWARVQRARFLKPRTSTPSQMVRAAAQALIVEAVPGVTVSNTATSTVKVGALTWERDREKAIRDMLAGIGAEAYFDRGGNLVIRDIPTLEQTPVWNVDAVRAGDDTLGAGVLLSARRSKDRTRTYNVVVVNPVAATTTSASYDDDYSANTDSGPVATWGPVIVKDTNPASATYVNGPFGEVPTFLRSPVITTSAQAQKAATAALAKAIGLAAQLDVESVVNPALDCGDVITVSLPDGVTETHIVDGLTIPLTPEGSMPIATRSSKPESNDATEEG